MNVTQFLARHPPPKQLSDLAALPCLVIKERDHPFGIWQLHSKEGQHAILSLIHISQSSMPTARWRRMPRCASTCLAVFSPG